jgi:hypothetical protein
MAFDPVPDLQPAVHSTARRKPILAAAMAGLFSFASVAPAAAAACTLPTVSVEGQAALDVVRSFSGLITEELSGYAQDKLVERIASQYLDLAGGNLADYLATGARRSENAFIRLSVNAEVLTTANQWLHVLKAVTIAKAIAAGEEEPIVEWVVDEAAELAVGSFAEAMGATSSGLPVSVLMQTLKTIKESYEELEHQDCLLNIDIGFYRFLEDKTLRWQKKDGQPGRMPNAAVDYYLAGYIRGGGPVLKGEGTREDHRRILQCFVNEEMPESERIDISSLGPSSDDGGLFGNFPSVFDRVGDALTSIENPQLRVPVNVMLRDFNVRADLMEQSRRLQDIVNDPRFEEVNILAKAMEVSALAAEWLCARMSGPDPALVGTWSGDFAIDGEPVFPLRLEIAGDGTVTGYVEAEGERHPLQELSVLGRTVAFDMLLTDEGESGAPVEIFDLAFSGELDTAGRELSGTYAGDMYDMGCVITNMFEEDPSKHKVCGYVPLDGPWQLTP